MTPAAMISLALSIASVAFLVLLVVRVRAKKRRGGGEGWRPGPGAAGAVYDLLNEDKRRSIELIAEGRAEATDPERARDKKGDGED